MGLHEPLLCAMILGTGVALSLLFLQLGHARYVRNQAQHEFCRLVAERMVFADAMRQAFERVARKPSSDWHVVDLDREQI